MRAHNLLIFAIAFTTLFGGVAVDTFAAQSAAAENEAPTILQLTRDASLILATACLECHGSDPKGGLDLRTRASAMKGGHSGRAIVPGSGQDSLLLHRVRAHEMPPKHPLTKAQIASLKQWIEAGASFPKEPLNPFAVTSDRRAGYDWWSLQPLQEVSPPDAASIPPDWQQNTIDRFIHAKLQSEGLSPSPPASPRVLIRRATYDLTGLPPAPADVEKFVQDCEQETSEFNTVGPRTYESLINRLLASPHYGEHWGRHWLDIVRFGESNGFERNVIITNAWPFRDYVIRSFNEDKPFDQFIKEHLAGDVIAPGVPEVSVGTTFLVCGPYDNVGNQDPVQAAQIRADTIDEMIRATTSAFLGFTVGCSRCHDHKFDPISQRDYYRLYATFAGVQHGDRELSIEPDPDVAGRINSIKSKLVEIDRQLFRFEPIASTTDSSGRKNVVQRVRPAVNSRRNSERIIPTAARFLRFEVGATNSGEPCIDELEVFTVETGEGQSRNIASTPGTKLTSSGNYQGNPKHQLKHVNDGEHGNSQSWISNESGGGWVQLEFPQKVSVERIVWGRDREGEYSDRLPTEYSIKVSADGHEWQTVASSVDRIAYEGEASSNENPLAVGLEAQQNPIVVRQLESRRQLTQDLAELQKQLAPPRWWVGQFNQNDGPYHVFLGGSTQRKGDAVQPASLQLVDAPTAEFRLGSEAPEPQRRMALARWMTSADQPITPRVLANRLWHYHFGTGIVNTPSDFGFMGGRPSHPQLLDWLALELQRQNWRLKPMHKLLMLSQTYRQASTYRADAARIDGESRLLWRFPPRRLSAEEIRDSMLSIAGKLDIRQGGPGFRLFRYVQDNVATYYPLETHGPETYRRAVYHHNARAMHVDLMTDFDSPDCAFSTPRRAATTTPLQALSLLNHQFTIDMADFLAQRVRRRAEEDGSKPIELAFRFAFSRLPDENESRAANRLVEQHGLRALCRALLNANELIYLN